MQFQLPNEELTGMAEVYLNYKDEATEKFKDGIDGNSVQPAVMYGHTALGVNTTLMFPYADPQTLQAAATLSAPLSQDDGTVVFLFETWQVLAPREFVEVHGVPSKPLEEIAEDPSEPYHKYLLSAIMVAGTVAEKPLLIAMPYSTMEIEGETKYVISDPQDYLNPSENTYTSMRDLDGLLAAMKHGQQLSHTVDETMGDDDGENERLFVEQVMSVRVINRYLPCAGAIWVKNEEIKEIISPLMYEMTPQLAHFDEFREPFYVPETIRMEIIVKGEKSE